MQNEKLPKDYNQSTLQKIIESIKGSIGSAVQKAAQDLFDTSQEIKDSINKLATKVADLEGEGEGEQGKAPNFVPAPQELKVYEFGNWGFAYVSPFIRWKYFGKIKGYEFYGSMNVDSEGDFIIHEEPYVQKGVHYSYNGSLLLQGVGTVADPNQYLNTKDPAETNSHILSIDLVKLIPKNRLILENVTRGTEGYIGSDGTDIPTLIDGYGTPNKYRLRGGNVGSFVTWVNEDVWRIKDYPPNRLFNIGSLAIFYKRTGNFYVKARSIGKGHSYSDFTEVVTSEGISSTASDIPPPNIVMPVHACNGLEGNKRTSCTLTDEEGRDFRPYCPACNRVVPWDEIVSGTREVDHFAFFGFEYSSVEFVWEEVDAEYGEFTYQTKRSIQGEDETFREGKVS
jgi:hypothetical protein